VGMIAEVEQRLAARGLPGRTTELVLAAMQGEGSLARVLDAAADEAARDTHDAGPPTGAPRPDGGATGGGTTDGGTTGTTGGGGSDGGATGGGTSGGEVAGGRPLDGARSAYLRSVRVQGFRGIGPAVALDLTPGPGLTLVVGRNGSGKSSFAEAAELALTGANARWDKRSKVWKDGWRNLHAGDRPTVAAEFVVDGQAGSTVVERLWDGDVSLEGATLSVRTPAGASSLVDLGWGDGLDLYRPFLPYSELGAMVDEGPTSLHDALAAVLGLEEMTAATKRLKDARLQRERVWKAAVADGRKLADDLAELEDERAKTAGAQLRSRSPDLGLLQELAAGAVEADATIDRLRELASLPGPDLDAVRRVARDLDEALAGAADHLGTDAARDLEVAELLGTARRVHAEHGDGDCPVCGTGHLDGAWAAAAERREQDLRASAAQVQRAQAELAGADRALRELVRPAPGIVARGGVVGVEVAGLLRAYEAWEAVPRHPDPRQRPSALLTAAADLAAAATVVREEAAALRRAREDAWRPFAVRLASWLGHAARAQAQQAPCEDLKHAEKQLGVVLDELRTQRWTPIADQAKEISTALRQRSNVSVEEVALAGTGVKRRVEVRVTVDGVDGAALGVMSQGELHALALSLFLPRATLPESPFRFLVLDDPVQSMDPARVDGLARVLDTVATERQVVVFTHDDRLPEAIRRLGITARVLEVSRGAESRVSVRETASPWRRHLDDARALARSDGVPELVRRTAVPGFCRLGIEAACADAVRRRELGAGRDHRDVEDDLADASKLLPLLGLTLFRDTRRAGEVYGRLDRHGRWAADAIRACNEGSHGRFGGDPSALVRDVEDLIEKVLS
jgi:recombinational DNA repair ATPase RecF